ncbi:MAG: DUF481 domain-containing protein [Pseudomonadota bacterium]
MRRATLLCLLAFLLTPWATVRAEEPPTPAVAPASPPAVAPAPVPESRKGEWKANAGLSAIINSGNSSNKTLGGNGLTSYKWERNKVEFAANGAYGRAEVKGVSTTNTKNGKTSLRYDRFLTDPLSLFALGHLGSDPPAGFDLRYGSSLGLAHELVKSDPHFFKYELGFDYTHERRVAPPNQDIYSARTFLQYKYNINKLSVIGQDVETLFDLQEGKNVRINTLTALTFKMTDVLAFQAGYAIRFDNVPVPGFKKTDTTTQFGLVMNLL